MNRLSTEKRVQVVSALVEGVSINATCRMSGVAKHTVLNLLRDLGCAAAADRHRNVRRLPVRRLQCDEIWAFVGAKARNASIEKRQEGWGDVWTWTAIDVVTHTHGHAVALYFMHCNHVRLHKTLRVTPAMEAGLADHVWSLEELVSLVNQTESADTLLKA